MTERFTTRSENKKYGNNYTRFTFYVRNDLKEFWDQLTGPEKGNRSNIGNHAFELYKAIYDGDMDKLTELIISMREFKNNGYYKKNI